MAPLRLQTLLGDVAYGEGLSVLDERGSQDGSRPSIKELPTSFAVPNIGLVYLRDEDHIR